MVLPLSAAKVKKSAMKEEKIVFTELLIGHIYLKRQAAE
jgi:hypothetical protein